MPQAIHTHLPSKRILPYVIKQCSVIAALEPLTCGALFIMIQSTHHSINQDLTSLFWAMGSLSPNKPPLTDCMIHPAHQTAVPLTGETLGSPHLLILIALIQHKKKILNILPKIN